MLMGQCRVGGAATAGLCVLQYTFAHTVTIRAAEVGGSRSSPKVYIGRSRNARGAVFSVAPSTSFAFALSRARRQQKCTFFSIMKGRHSAANCALLLSFACRLSHSSWQTLDRLGIFVGWRTASALGQWKSVRFGRPWWLTATMTVCHYCHRSRRSRWPTYFDSY